MFSKPAALADVVIETAAEYPDIVLPATCMSTMPRCSLSKTCQFDVVVNPAICSAMFCRTPKAKAGSISLLASVSLRTTAFGTFGLYEPIHGKARRIQQAR
jgi:3-isopropylmalate dehydrogenase